MRPRIIHAVLILGLLGAAWPPPAEAAPAEPPSAVVERLNAVLIEVMRGAEALGYQGRFDRLAPVLTEAFNFPVMAGISVGRHWRTLDGEQRARLVESFGRMSIGTFASRFDGYDGERWEVVGEEDGPRDSVLVRNRLIKSSGEAVDIDYLLKAYDQRWRVIDVFLESKYSELAVKRSEYSSVIANEGFDALIRKIDEKLADFAAEG